MIRGTAEVIKANALDLPVPDESVDLIITSPPYFALRSYRDGGEHYDGQVGSEDTPGQFIDALLAATREMVRVLKPSGSIWVNLGDKYAGSGGHNNAGVAASKGSGSTLNGPQYSHKAVARDTTATRRNAPDAYNKASDGIRAKSLMGLPWRYAIRCIDELGLILRAEIVWDKPNGLPESVGDRVRRSHEQWFHFVKSPSYFAAIDEVREAHADPRKGHNVTSPKIGVKREDDLAKCKWNPSENEYNPLGKLPGSVWRIASEPLKVPEELGVDHFAAFPAEWPRRIILGWSPGGICTVCGEGRRPVGDAVALDMSRPQARRAHELARAAGLTEAHYEALLSVGISDTGRGAATQSGTGKNSPQVYELAGQAREALGGYAREYLLRRPTTFRYACKCDDTTAPTIPATVLDPFGGTGTVAMVAKALGRKGISVDLSADYCRLAEWRTNDEKSLESASVKTRVEQLQRRARARPVPRAASRYLSPESRRLSASD